MGGRLLSIFFLCFSMLLMAQETSVPDANFENYLETHDADGNVVALGDATSLGNGIANDGKVLTVRIASVTELDIADLGIVDATGIEGFIALRILRINDNSLTSLDLSGNTALENLNCYKNNLSSINISQNTSLEIIQCFRNVLTSLDVSNNPALTRIDAFTNQLTSLDLSQNTALESLNCARNQLTTLDLSNNILLERLSCYDNDLTELNTTMLPLLTDLDCVENEITSLDLSKNVALEYLQVYENQLTSLDISKNVKLIELYAEYNQITSLDVSNNTALVDLSCYSNQLTYLNIRNGNNTNLDSGDFDIRNNPNLTCISVDDASYATANFTKKDAHMVFNTFCNTTNVPDDNFEAYLETHNATGGVVPVGDVSSMGNGIANDNMVGTERIKGIKSLNISSQGITDFTGLEAFLSLEQFRAFGNSVTSLDLTANRNLTEIACSDMGLTSINLSGLIALEKVELRNNNLGSTGIDLSTNTGIKYLYLDGNSLTTINVSANTALLDLRVRENSLSSLDISSNLNLTRLYCKDNLLTSLDVSNNTLLETLSCGENQFTTINVSALTQLTDLFIEDTPTLTALDVSQNTNLEDIGVNNNTSLTTLDLSNHTKLVEVYTNGSQITSLDFSKSPNIEYIECQNGALTSLNLKNGNNSSDIELYATGNSNLRCIQVDNASASYLSSWEKDVSAVFGIDCNWTYVPDDNFENYLETHDASNNVVAVGDPNSMGNGIANDNYVITANIKNITNLFVAFQGITDLTGIEDFEDLEVLFCFNNNINGSIDFTSNTNLKRIDCGDMGLTSINITGLTALEQLGASRNELTTIDVSTNTALKTLILSSNDLSGLNISNNTALEDLQVHETGLTSIDISVNTNLTRIIASLNPITDLNTENNTLLEYINLSKTSISSIAVNHLPNLEELFINETVITSLNLSANTKLVEFSARKSPNLNYLNLKNGNNANITDFETDNCPNLTCIEVDDPSAAYLSSWTKDATTNFAQYCRFTYVPDDNFENYLETHRENTGAVPLGDDRSLGNGVMDDLVPTEKIESLGILFIENQNISDFTGLAEFKGLERFRAHENPVNGNLDLTPNTNLTQVFCWNMGLTGINLTGLTSLSQFDVNNNSLTSINLSTNTALSYVDIEENNLTSINLTNNTELTSINYNNNSISTIDLSQNTKLISLFNEGNSITTLNLQNNTLVETLEIGNNPLTSINVSMLPNLVNLKINNTSISTIDLSNNLGVGTFVCNNTNITELDLSGNTNMYTLEVHNNAITELDIRKLTRLNTLNCSNNQLTYLNLRNGENDGISNVDITGNTNLTCISVDDPTATYLSAWSKDATANYASYCELTHIADTNFENYLETHDANGNVVPLGDLTSMGNGITGDNQVATSKIKTVTTLSIPSLSISDLSGIEEFTALESLNVDYNDLTTLPISSNTKLKILNAAENDLININLSTNTALEEVNLRSNKIETLLVNNNPALKKLITGKNRLTSLDLTACIALEELTAHYNDLLVLDVRNGNNHLITDFFVLYNSNLTCIEVDDASAAYLTSWEKDDIASFSENCNNIIWSGANNTTWNTSGNWIGNTQPQTTSNVAIPNTANTPVINSGMIAEVNDLKMATLASFDISDNGAVLVNGNLQTTGTINISSSTASSGTLIVKGTANGTVNYERTGLEANKWSIITAPVSGQSIKAFVENTNNNIRVNNTVTPNRYAVAYYDDNNPEGAKWVYYTSDDLVDNSITFQKGKGYIVSRATNGSMFFTGTLETANVSVTVHENQWNALGSPYTAYLPINNNSGNNFIQDNLSNFDPINVGIYVWDNVQHKYIVKSLLDPANSLNVGQGFFMKTTTGVNTLSFKKEQRINNGSEVAAFSKNTNFKVKLNIASEGVTVSTNINYLPNATKGLDPGYDVGNFGGADFDVYSHLLEDSKGNDFTIQSLPNSDYENMVVPIGIKAKEGKKVDISAEISNIPSNLKVYIEDKEAGKMIRLDEGGKYTVTINSDITGVGRFYVHTSSGTLGNNDPLNNLAIRIYNSGKQQVTVEGIPTGTGATVSVFAITGQKLSTQIIKAQVKNVVALSNLEVGLYIVRVKTDKGSTSKKIIIKK